MSLFKKLIKKIVPGFVFNAYKNYNSLNYRLNVLENQNRMNWLADKQPPTKDPVEMLRRKEFKIFSQGGEDGIINYIFSRIGIKNKTFIEFGIEDGRECNSANLVFNFGWKGLFIEGYINDALKAREYYKNFPVKVLGSFVTKENINQLILKSGICGEIDLLSVDIDGNDYWLWNAINVINPRVVIAEYNSSLGKEPITIKYNPGFQRLKAHKSGLYYGASLSALVKLAHSKGYIFAGSSSLGVNAFFIRKDLAGRKFQDISPEKINYPNTGRINRFGDMDKQFKLIKHLKFVRV